MSLIPFPNVPQLPGVPPLPRLPFQVSAVVAVLAQDDPTTAGATGPPRWGIFNSDGDPVAEADSFVSFEHSKDWRLLDYPVEEGGFQSYNKVQTPYDERVVLAKGGKEEDRASFLNAVQAAAASLELYSVVTPEITYVNANVLRYAYARRSSNGVTLLMVELWVREVRTGVTTAFSNTKDPASANPANGGTVQAQAPTTGQTAAAGAGG